MAYEMKDMSGSLFREQDKKSEKSPDYTGKVKIDGKELRIAGWIKQSKGGSSYLSLAFSEPRTADGQVSRPSAKANDDIPF
jgi:uncharacterized protein (DUF736 family)